MVRDATVGELMIHEFAEKGVRGAQNLSSMCLVCGEDNPFSLHTQFLDMEDGSICATFTTGEAHQSYPGRVHGGIISAVLDEVIGRAVQVAEPDVFGVTMELQVKYRQPVPLGVELKVVGRITQRRGRVFEGTGELLLADGTVAAQAQGRYMALSVDTICDGGLTEPLWHPDERDWPGTVLA
jgi:uncharacterized protein (TIGR00369 family)